MKRKAFGSLLPGIAILACLALSSPAGASGTCPTTDDPVDHLDDPSKWHPPVQAGASGISYSVDTADVMPFGVGVGKSCGTWSTSGAAPGQGHFWVNGACYFGTAGVCTPYVAIGNDRVGNPDGSNGSRSDCAWNESRKSYTNHDGGPCTQRRKTGPYVCVSTDGQPIYGPGIGGGRLVCPVNQ